ncbi:hypothetical protein [Bacillus cereus]|uniref:hypothetical protein n=1 Tax=Bacillus cereus TaxID=1396 RepID=UPI00397FC87D
MSEQLRQLFARLKTNVDPDGHMKDLIRALGSSSRIGKLLADLTEDKMISVRQTSVTYNSQTSVVLKGVVDEFGFETAPIQADFTENDQGKLQVHFLVTTKIEWSYVGVPWIVFYEGKLDIEIVDKEDGVSKSKLEVTTYMGKKKITFQVEFPGYQFELVSAGEKPSLIDLQRFLGGFNLNRILPSDLLKNLEVSGLKFFYNKTLELPKIEWMQASLISPDIWEVGPFKIEDVYVGVKVDEPVQKRDIVIGFQGKIVYTSADDTQPFTLIAKGASTPDFELSIYQEKPKRWILLSNLIDLVGQEVIDVFGNTVKASEITALFVFKKSRIELTASVLLDVKIPLNKPFLMDASKAGELYDLNVKVTTIDVVKTISISAKVKLPGNVELEAEAEYIPGKDWVYSAEIKDNEIDNLYKILEALTGIKRDNLPELSNISFKAVPKEHKWEITAVSEKWTIPGINQIVRAHMTLLVENDQPEFNLSATFYFHGASFDICYNGNDYALWWEEFKGELDPEEMTAKFLFGNTVNLGSIMESAVSWVTGIRYGLAPPWDQLHQVSMEGTSLDVCFKEGFEELSFTKTLNENLIFAHVTFISVEYKPKSEERKGINVVLEVTYKWGEKTTLNWNAADPSGTPAPAGEGKEFFMLRLLALGQNISTSGMPYENVKEAIADIRKFPEDPLGGEGNIAYNPDAGWLIATDFSVLKDMMTLELIFNDPSLYGLRLAFDEKFLKGLEFEIMYQKISDSIGLYQAELTLPDDLRYWEYGAYSITLPSFGIGIYTNGDFKVDIGFPHNMDFSRSFTVQTVASGIPVIGSAGFYLNKLSGATSTRVPVSTKGHFNPVMELGLGMRLGIGKEFQKGPLKAGISVVIIAMIEGVMASWNEWDENQGKKDFYFWMQGTTGIQGKLFGAVDLGLVVADIDVTITLATQLTYEAYRNLDIAVFADVDISIQIKFRCGPIRFRVTLQYAARIQENFELQAAGTAPWDENTLALKSEPLQKLLFEMNWDGLCPIEDETQRHRLQARLVPTPSVQRNEIAQDCFQKTIYILLLAMDTMPDLSDDGSEAADWSSFEVLCRQIFRWLVAACKEGNLDETEVDQDPISMNKLCRIKDILGWKDLGTEDSWTPIPIEAIEAFMKGQFFVDITYILPSETVSDVNLSKEVTFFPMAPKIVLTVPDPLDPSKPPIHHYRFSDVACAKQDYLKCLEDQMRELAVEVERETRAGTKAKRTLGDRETISIADFCFADYILLISRFLCQSAIDTLGNFDYPLQSDLTVTQMTNVIKDNCVVKDKQSFNSIHLLEAMAERTLAAKQALIVKEAKYRVMGEETLTNIVEKVYRSLFTLEEFAVLNVTNKKLLLPGVKVIYKPETPDEMIMVLKKGDTLGSLLCEFKCTMAELIEGSTVFTQKILEFGAILEIPTFTYTTEEGDTLHWLTGEFGVSFTSLAMETANTLLRDLFDQADVSPIPLGRIDEIKSGVLLEKLRSQHELRVLSGLVSRVFMHGLCLPTEGIIWDEEIKRVPQAEECGLYMMTGQQFELPDFDQILSLSLDATDVPWITFK